MRAHLGQISKGRSRLCNNELSQRVPQTGAPIYNYKAIPTRLCILKPSLAQLLTKQVIQVLYYQFILASWSEKSVRLSLNSLKSA